eukprot:scaffold701_cov158-Amphora_coffeaeformis.AAC.19
MGDGDDSILLPVLQQPNHTLSHLFINLTMKLHFASLVLTTLVSAGNSAGQAAAFTSQQMQPSSPVALSSSTSAAQEQQAEKSSMFGRFLDEEALMKQSSFSISPDQLIARAREILSPDVGIGTKDGGACLADDFEFAAAVVGPIGKREYLAALTSFNLEDSFDITPNFYGFSVDPMQPNRVWFFNRVTAYHTGDFLGAAPTGKEIIYPPQVQHLDFNEDGFVKEYGFYTADRRQGNTGGLGGAFGFMWAVGRPFPAPEGKPYKRSWQFRLVNFLGSLRNKRASKED